MQRTEILFSTYSTSLANAELVGRAGIPSAVETLSSDVNGDQGNSWILAAGGDSSGIGN